MHAVIVGASLAGLRSAQALRAAGFGGRLTLIGDEPHPPYDRPPLSKQILASSLGLDDIVLADDEAFRALRIEMALGTRAIALDSDAQTVALGDGRAIEYDELVIATGARARRIATFEGVAGAHTLRTLDDALALRAALEGATAVVVVGAGFIGAEVASTARTRGLPTTVLESAPAPYSRVMGAAVGHRLGRLQTDAGVDLRCGVGVEAPLVTAGRVRAVRLADGSSVAADLAVVGVGSVPNTEWLGGSGLDIADGVACDGRGRANGVRHVHAVGDVARWASERFDDNVRTEHWSCAGDQAASIAADILDQPRPAESVPYVWSEQFGHRIQIAGRCHADNEVVVGRDDADVFVAVGGRSGRVRSIVAVNDPKSFGRVRRLIANGASFAEATAALSG